MCRAYEASKNEVNSMLTWSNPVAIAAVARSKPQVHMSANAKSRQPISCYNCGYERKSNHKCPALDQQCDFCHNMNHFAAVCRKKQASAACKSSSGTKPLKHMTDTVAVEPAETPSRTTQVSELKILDIYACTTDKAATMLW